LALSRSWVRQVRKLGDLDGDIYLSFIAQLRNGNRDENGWTWINSAQLLDYRGIVPRTEKTESGKVYRAGHRHEDLEEIAGCVERMRNTRITVDQAIYEEPTSPRSKKKGPSKKTRFTRESPLFQFGDVIRKEDLWEEAKATLPLEIAWQVKESAWMEPFIHGTNAAIGTLLQSCLEYDPYHEIWEKRLSRYLLFHLRTNRHSTSITRKIETLLDDLSLIIDERNPMRTKDRFEKALNRLKTDGHIAIWQYQEEVQLPARKWLETWRGQHIIFTAPIVIE
jgi:hypothetical protein